MNNPINMDDYSGNWPSWVTKLIIGVAVIVVVAIVTVATAGAASGTLAAAVHCFAVGAVNGAVVAGVTGAVNGGATAAVSHRISTGSWDGVGNAILEGAADGFMKGTITGAILGGVTSNVCFIAGTTVLTSLGLTVIEDIKQGDKVWSENPETGEIELKEVVQTFVNETDELVHVYVNGEEIVTTPEHPFYVQGIGWISAKYLREGDHLDLFINKIVIVDKIKYEKLDSPIKVYNFEVEDFHTYYVGEYSILVHNTCTRREAMRSAKRSLNIPMSQKPTTISMVKMTGENGRTYFAKMEFYGNKYIRNDLGGHLFKDGITMGRHFNAGIIDDIGREISNGIHFFY